jgi:hypothetical protein
MTTKELIAELQRSDPTGEEQVVCPGNEAILCVERIPAYHDGACEELIKNENGLIIGGRLRREGKKVRIVTCSLEWALLDNPDLPIEVPTKKWDHSEHCKQEVERWRTEARKITEELKPQSNKERTCE